MKMPKGKEGRARLRLNARIAKEARLQVNKAVAEDDDKGKNSLLVSRSYRLMFGVGECFGSC